RWVTCPRKTVGDGMCPDVDSLLKTPRHWSSEMTERRALVVEVDAATQLGLLGFLRVRGYLCVAVSSAAEAQEALTDGSFSFTLVDLTSNGTDAGELIERWE